MLTYCSGKKLCGCLPLNYESRLRMHCWAFACPHVRSGYTLIPDAYTDDRKRAHDLDAFVQVSVASADGFAFGPIAACSAIEAARESAAQATNPRGSAAVGRRLSLTFTGESLWPSILLECIWASKLFACCHSPVDGDVVWVWP